jgi:hypothetical protein
MPPQYGQPAPKKSNTRKIIFIVAGVALALCVGCVVIFGVIGFGAFNQTQPAATTGENFMTALKNGNYSSAYNMCGADLKNELGSVQGLENLITQGRVQPVSWNFSSRNTSGNQAQLDGSATFSGNRNGTVRIVLEKSGNDWQIIGFNLKETK